jgi:phosphoglucosamine mutase
MTLRFGTDGVRGDASELTPVLVAALGRAAATVLGGGAVVIGRDTRESGQRIEADLAGGIAAGGGAPRSLGVVPTPAVAYLSAADGVIGAMISASHNPWHDNGVKFFAPGGRKLTDTQEEALEAELDRILHGDDADRVTVVERASGPETAASRRWIDAVRGAIDGRRLDGLAVVIDCANGACSAFAPDVLRSLGATVTVLHDAPDGRNINDGCGSTHPEDVQARVVELGADVGLAFDGDADRVLAVDADGRLIDGDQLIAICAIDRHERGLLPTGAVVVTVMTNLGFHRGMGARGIDVVTTPVGDRAVLEAMEAGGHTLGGEQSGHIIFRDHATTGDGLLSAVQVLDVMARTGRTLADLANDAMVRLPQVLRNVRVAQRVDDVAERLADAIAAAESRLGDDGRVLVRSSGTEPLVRIMVEAPTHEEADEVVADLEAATHTALG